MCAIPVASIPKIGWNMTNLGPEGWYIPGEACGCTRIGPEHELLAPAKDVICPCVFDPACNEKTWDRYFTEVFA